MIGSRTLRKLRWLIGAVFLGFGICANATLIDRGNGLIYDDVLDVTWLQDASLGGNRNWNDAVAWADALVFEGFDDWRLPAISVAGGLPTGFADLASIVQCASATELACRDNEFGYMYFHNLAGFGDLSGDQGLIQNIQVLPYWSGTGTGPGSVQAWAYFFSSCCFGTLTKSSTVRPAWAVRPGDVLAVPEPTTLLLLGLGLVVFAGVEFTRRRRR